MLSRPVWSTAVVCCAVNVISRRVNDIHLSKMPVSRRTFRGLYDRFETRRERDRRDQRFGADNQFERGISDSFETAEGAMILEEEGAAGRGASYGEGAATATETAVIPSMPISSPISTADAADAAVTCGYDAKFETPLDKKYVCPVCLSALREPVQTKCGHRFCKVCLTLASGPGNAAKCPLDKLWFDVRSEVFEDVAMKREVLSLSVLCTNQDCEWKGELRELEEHSRDCPHAMIPCSNGCLTHHKRMDTEEHHNNCASRLVECTFCQQSIVFKSLKQHQLLLCPRYAIDCPLCGKVNILREDDSQATVGLSRFINFTYPSKKKSSLASYLSQTPQGLALVKHLNAGGTLSIPQRRQLVRLSVSYLVEKCGNLYPGTDEKTTLAKEIVQTWSATKDATPGLQGHIEIEFSVLHPDVCDNFVKKWDTFYRPRVIALAKRDFPAVQQVIADFEESSGDVDLCGLIALLFILHRPVSRKKGREMSCSRPGALMYLIQNLPMPKHTDHKDGDCPKSIVPCKFGTMGCHAQVRRCDLQLHSQESQGLHLELLLSHYTTQTEHVQEQVSIIHDLQETCSRLVGQNADADRKIRELSGDVRSLRNEFSLALNTNYTGQLQWKVQICSRDFTAPLHSPPFYTSPGGYMLRLCLELRGHVTRSDSYTSIFIMLCKGENDRNLYFPFSAVCTLTLFDQADCENHLTTNITCHKMPRPQEVQSTMQRRGRLQFMKTDTLINGRFCKAGTLFLQARVTTLPASHAP